MWCDRGPASRCRAAGALVSARWSTGSPCRFDDRDRSAPRRPRRLPSGATGRPVPFRGVQEGSGWTCSPIARIRSSLTTKQVDGTVNAPPAQLFERRGYANFCQSIIRQGFGQSGAVPGQRLHGLEWQHFRYHRAGPRFAEELRCHPCPNCRGADQEDVPAPDGSTGRV